MIGGAAGTLPEALAAGLPLAVPRPELLAAAAHPELALPFAFGGGLLVLAWLVARRRARERLARLVGADPGGLRGPGRELALLLALAAIGAAWVGPALGVREERIPAGGRDVVLLLDASTSMRARDVPPSRLARARALAAGLLEELGPGDRAALAAFAEGAALLTPLTPDREALAELLPGIDTDLIAPQGSNLAEGLRVALTAFDSGSARPRVVVLLSDGEDPERREAPGAALRRAGVRVVAVGVGGDRPVPIPRGAGGGSSLLDDRGRVVHTRRDTKALQALVAETGGRLLLTDRLGRIRAAELTAAMGGGGGSLESGGSRRVPARRSTEFAALAFLVLLLEAASRGRRPEPAPGAACLAAAVLVLTAAPVRGGPGAARPVPGPRALIEAGLQRAREGHFEAARRAFAAAAVTATDPALAALASYDLGVVALETGDLPRARDAFLDALALEPEDVSARFNLEWVLEALARTPPTGRRRPGEGPAELPDAASDPDEPEPSPRHPAEPAPREAGATGPADPGTPAAGSEPSPPREASPSENAGPRPVPPLEPEEIARVLRQVREDPRSGLRALAGPAGGGSGPSEHAAKRSRHPW